MSFTKSLALLIGVLLISISCGDHHDKELWIREINTAMDKQVLDWNEGNIEAFMGSYMDSPELSFTTKNGITKGYDTVLERYMNSYPSTSAMGTLKFEILEFDFFNENHALVIGKWALENNEGNPNGYFSLIWKRTHHGWKIIHDHTS